MKILFVFLLLPCFLWAQKTVCEKSQKVFQMMDKLHQDSLIAIADHSNLLFENYIEAMDPGSNFLKKEDVEQLATLKTDLFKQLKAGKCDFFLKSCEIYKKRLTEYRDFIKSLKTTLTKSQEKINVNDYDKNKHTTGSDWELKAKKKILIRINDYIYSKNPDKTFSDIKDLEKWFNEAKNSVIESYVCKLEKRLNPVGGIDNDLGEKFLDALAGTFDPHSNYFSSDMNALFTAMLSSRAKSFGVSFKKEEDGFKIAYISPGSDAWRSNLLHKNDEVTEILIDDKPVDLVCNDETDVEKLMGAINSKKLTITFIDHSKKKMTIHLFKEILQSDENTIRSFVLKGSKKIGYISLPAFYSSDDDETGCSKELATEILKIKKENIDGLILDLRDNGGGSLMEGLGIIGLFIDEGPLALRVGRDKKVRLLKDPNRGLAYDGPLAVMVNGHSASASEIVAASLQDYNRAVIVGSQTFGKSTAQVVFPINMDIRNPMKSTSAAPGHVKITIGKIYRLNGESYQNQGVKPDIVLPDFTELQETRESKYPNSLQHGVVKKDLEMTKLNPLPISTLQGKSSSRTNNSEYFNGIKKAISFFNAQKNSLQSLSLEQFWIEQNLLAKKTQELEDLLDKKASLFQVQDNAFDLPLIQMDETFKEVNNQNKERIQTDLHIEETFSVLTDLINQK